ncbi:MAG: hypothetical protein ABFR31_06835 [Thermodesulfobacteriota bacterium]
MLLDPNPFFRKAITPWYDSNIICQTLIIFMLFVFVFAIFGIVVAFNNIYFIEHVWFPCFLAFLSLFLVIKIFLRLRKRFQTDTI